MLVCHIWTQVYLKSWLSCTHMHSHPNRHTHSYARINVFSFVMFVVADFKISHHRTSNTTYSRVYELHWNSLIIKTLQDRESFTINMRIKCCSCLCSPTKQLAIILTLKSASSSSFCFLQVRETLKKLCWGMRCF